MADAQSRRLARATARDVVAALDELLPQLQERRAELSPNITQDQIIPVASSFVSEVQPLMFPVEEFYAAAAGENWSDGVEGALHVASALISYGDRQSGLRFTSGLPTFLAFRLLLIVGGRAVREKAPDSLRVVLRTDLELELLGGRTSFKPLPELSILFFPETFLGYADLPMRYLSSAWDAGLEKAFIDQEEYRESVVWFLATVALLDDSSEEFPLYPGYRLFDGAQRSLDRMVRQVARVDEFAGTLAAAFDETIDEFRASWPRRAASANSASLGHGYYRQNKIRTELTAV